MGLCQEMRGNPRWITLVSLYSTSTLDQHHTVCLYHFEFHNGLPDNLGRDALFSFHSRVTNQEPLIQELLLFKLSCPAWNDWTGQTPNGFFFFLTRLVIDFCMMCSSDCMAFPCGFFAYRNIIQSVAYTQTVSRQSVEGAVP